MLSDTCILIRSLTYADAAAAESEVKCPMLHRGVTYPTADCTAHVPVTVVAAVVAAVY